MLEKVKAYIKENSMLKRKDRIVIGVSGGADSVCLFFVLLSLQGEYELALHAVHINHGIRGQEADRDESFVRELCRGQSIQYTCFRADIPAMAKEQRLSEEETGRVFRYERLEQVRRDWKGSKIAVAHNENDCAETVLFHLFRGTGLVGLTGISPVRDNIIRPLLCVSRREIEDFLEQRQQPFCTDHTNFNTEYTRNQIRLKILPAAEKINEKAIEHTAYTARLLRQVSGYMEKQIKEGFLKNVSRENGAYSIGNGLLQEDPVIIKGVFKRAMEELAGSRRDLESRHIELLEQLFSRSVGKELRLPYGITARRSYEGICLFRQAEKAAVLPKGEEEYSIVVPGEYTLANGEKISFELLPAGKKLAEIPKNDCTKWFDYDRIKNVLSLRHRKTGDYFQIEKNGGRKKLKDDLIDRKIPRAERDRLWLLADGSHVMWVLGGRTSEAYQITEETVTILRVKRCGGK